MSSIEISIKSTISPVMVDAIFSAAFYDGIVYWCPQANPVSNEEKLTVSATLFEDEEETGENMIEHQIDGPKIIAAMKHILEEKLVRDDLWEAIMMAVREEDACYIDSECADVIFQVAVFGEVKYG